MFLFTLCAHLYLFYFQGLGTASGFAVSKSGTHKSQQTDSQIHVNVHRPLLHW